MSTASQSTLPTRMRKAVIDIGSNSLLLAVAEQTENGWVTIAEQSVVTGLGTGTKRTGKLSTAGSAKTLAALREAFDTARHKGAQEIIAAGTMALRIAEDSDQFLHAAAAQSTPATILSAEDEARLGFLAVAEDPTFADAYRITTIDPGGHSTEIQTADRTSKGWKTQLRKSFPVGALGIIETAAPSESPGPAERLAAMAEIDKAIGLDYLPHQHGQVVCLGATATNLVSIREKLVGWDPHRIHGQTLEYEEVSRAAGWLLSLSLNQRQQIIGIEPGRELTLPIGALILERALFAVKADACRVSVRGWRHALFDHTPES